MLGSLGGSTRRKSSLMSHISRWRRGLGSRRMRSISYDPVSEGGGDNDLHRHHEKQGSMSKGEALLPLLPEVSTFTWSDLRSKNTSAESSTDDDGLDTAETHSFPTNAATLSHHTSYRTEASQGPHLEPRIGTVGTSAGGALPPQSAAVSFRTQAPRDPQTKRSLTPPGLSSKASSASLDSYTDYIHPDALFAGERDRAPAAEARPRVSLPQAASATYFDLPGVEMEVGASSTAHAHPHTKSRSGSQSRPGSLQLPSPPDSPPPPAHSSSSRSHGHGRSSSYAPSLSVAPGTSRPTLAPTRSAPITTALPFRPPASGPTSSTPAWWSTASAHHPSTLSPPHSPPRPSFQRASQPPVQSTGAAAASRGPSPQPSLTQAFRTPLQRSPSQSSQAQDRASVIAGMEDASGLGRYPSVTVSPAAIEESPSSSRSRHRSATVSGSERPISTTGERPTRTPQGARPRPGPVEALRQASSSTPSRSAATTPGEGYERSKQDESERKAYLRASLSLPQTPQVVDKSSRRREKGQSVALGYFDAPHATSSTAGEAGASRGPSSALASAAPASTSRSPAVRASDYALPDTLAPLPSSSSSRRHSVSTHQPNLVRRHDSPALRPLPASTLFYPASPPTSPPARGSSSLSRAPSIRRADPYLGGRSRSGSVASLAVVGERPEREAEGPEAKEERERKERERRERRERRESTASRRAVLPPVQRLAPLDLGELNAELRTMGSR